MANLSKPSKFAIHPVALDGEPSTEQEFKESCDINIMLRNAHRGQQLRGGGSTTYGHDDIGMDATALRIQKADLEEALLSGQKEFTAEQLAVIPKHIQEKFGYKLKASSPEPKNNDLNDENGEENKPLKQPKKSSKKQALVPDDSQDES